MKSEQEILEKIQECEFSKRQLAEMARLNINEDYIVQDCTDAILLLKREIATLKWVLSND